MCDAVYFGHLRLEVKSSKQGDLIVPVRSSGGRIALPGFGGRTVSQGAAAALARSEDIPEAELLAGMHGPWNLAVGQVPETELYRRSNQTWCLLPAPTSPSDITSDCVPDDQVLRGLADADVILIEGAAAGSPAVESGALRALKLRREDPRIRRLGHQAVARGCLEANERLRRGDPAYYDFLPQLEINALVNGAPDFVSLIPKGMKLKGDEVYRRRAPGRFAVGAGASVLTFYLIKEDFEHPRKGRSGTARKSRHPTRYYRNG